MRYCKRCIYPENHPLNLTFNEDGICSGCEIHEEKDKIFWSEKEQKLKEKAKNEMRDTLEEIYVKYYMEKK